MFLSPAESEFEKILLKKGFMVAGLKQSVNAPSLQGAPHVYIIIPDFLAVDLKGEGWCFEVKDEIGSKSTMDRLEMPRGYSGPVWYLEPWKAESYLQFSRAFRCPCIIAVRGRTKWKLGFFTRNLTGRIEYNTDLVVPGWRDHRGYPVLFNVMSQLDRFFSELDRSRKEYWKG